VEPIRTPRLVLRQWRTDDRTPFAALNADPEVMRYFPATLDRAASDAMVDRISARIEADGVGLWALERRDTGEFIGFTGLAPMPDWSPGTGRFEVGWRLCRAAWGQGFATEAACEALRVATKLGEPEAWSLTAATNERSIAVMRRIGLEYATAMEHPGLPVEHVLRPHVFYRKDLTRSSVCPGGTGPATAPPSTPTG